MTEHETVHAIPVTAPPSACYDVVRDVTSWPLIFGPTVHVEHLERGATTERFRIWAMVDGAVNDWTSHRTFDPDNLRITFAQDHSSPPVASMTGEWSFRPGEARLAHRFTATDEGRVDWIRAALDRNSAAELAALRDIAQLDPPLADVRCSFDDTVEIDGSVADAYQFVHEAQCWPDRLPHVRAIDVVEDPAGIQLMSMDTVTPDGAVHTTKSARICFADSLISYKQTTLPPLLKGHYGQWRFTQDGGRARVTAWHSALIDPGRIEEFVGPGATLADAIDAVRTALGGNSRTTLEHAKAFAEQRVRV